MNKEPKSKIICPICGLDIFEDNIDLKIHLEDCEENEELQWVTLTSPT